MKIGFLTVHTKDIEKSVQFYEKVMGFKIARSFEPRPGMKIVFLDDGSGNQIEFIWDGSGKAYEGKNLSLGFNVANIADVEQMLRKNGVEIVFGPATMPNGTKLLNARDPNGLELGFVQNPSH